MRYFSPQYLESVFVRFIICFFTGIRFRQTAWLFADSDQHIQRWKGRSRSASPWPLSVFGLERLLDLVEQCETPSAARRLALRDFLIATSAIRPYTRPPLFDRAHGIWESCVCVCLHFLPYMVCNTIYDKIRSKEELTLSNELQYEETFERS